VPEVPGDKQERPVGQQVIHERLAAGQGDVTLPVMDVQTAWHVNDLDEQPAKVRINLMHQHGALPVAPFIWKGMAQILLRDLAMPAVETMEKPGQEVGKAACRREG